MLRDEPMTLPHCCGILQPAELIPSYLEIHKENFTRQKKGSRNAAGPCGG